MLLLITSRTNATELSDLPTQVNIQSVLSNVTQDPTQYLPHYTEAPKETELLTENAELSDVSAAKEHASTKITQEVYQAHADEIAKRSQLPVSDNVTTTNNLYQILIDKYRDCQKMGRIVGQPFLSNWFIRNLFYW